MEEDTSPDVLVAFANAKGDRALEAVAGRAQASSMYNLFYYSGSSLFGWLGGVFFVTWGWAGTAVMIALLSILAGALAILLLKNAPTAEGQSSVKDASRLPSGPQTEPNARNVSTR